MSTDRDTTRIVRSWLRTDENDSADRVLGTVLHQLDTTPQRRGLLWPAQRTMPMNIFAKVALAAAAVLVAATIGFSVLSGPDVGVPGPTTNPTPFPTPSPTAAITSGPSAATGAFVIASPYLPYAEVHSPHRDGWQQNFNFVFRQLETGGRIGFSAWSTDGVYADPCRWQTSSIEWGAPDDAEALPGDDGHAADFIVPLMNQPDREPSTPVEYRISDWGGIRVDLSVPDGLDPATCDLGRYVAWTDTSDPTGGNWNHQEGQSDTVIFVDIDRQGVIIHGWFTADATGGDRDELEEMLSSVEVGFPEDFPADGSAP